MTDVFYVSGSKGGTGATTCAVMLGAALAKEGERTLIIDGDDECASVLSLCGLQGLSVYTLADAESGACRVKQAILQHPHVPDLYVLPTLGCKEKTTAENAVKECEGLFDCILCDKTARVACNSAILVCEPYSASVTAARKKTTALKDGGFKNVSLIVNKINGGLVFGGAVPTPQEIASLAGARLVGAIPEDLSLPLGKIKPSTQRAFTMTALKLKERDDKIYGVIKPYAGIKGLIKRKMREMV